MGHEHMGQEHVVEAMGYEHMGQEHVDMDMRMY